MRVEECEWKPDIDGCRLDKEAFEIAAASCFDQKDADAFGLDR